MQTSIFNTPVMFGDHHVTEVRRILLSLPGVQEVYASSAFRAVEVTFDPKKVSAEQIETCLKEAGYWGDLPLPAELETAAVKHDGNGRFRHTAVYETVKQTVSFAQQVDHHRRPLWPCPGLDGMGQNEKLP